MTESDVVGLLDELESAGVRVWIDGGWGVDALFGEQLRPAFDEQGNGIYQMDDGDTWTYPADGLAGSGSIGGRPVCCLTPELQMRVHTGYELREKDHEEIRALNERFGVPPPAGYEWPGAHGGATPGSPDAAPS